jgi:hypothetical protein
MGKLSKTLWDLAMKATELLRDLGRSLWLDNILGDLLDCGLCRKESPG